MARNLILNAQGRPRQTAIGTVQVTQDGPAIPVVDLSERSVSGLDITFTIEVPAGIAYIDFMGTGGRKRFITTPEASNVFTINHEDIVEGENLATTIRVRYVTTDIRYGPSEQLDILFEPGSIVFEGTTTLTFDPAAAVGARLIPAFATPVGGGPSGPVAVETLFRTRPSDSDPWTDRVIVEFVPSEWEGLEIVAVIRAQSSAGDWAEDVSDPPDTIAEEASGTPEAQPLADIVAESYYPEFVGQTDPETYLKGKFKFPTGPIADAIAAEKLVAIRGTINGTPPYGYEFLVPRKADGSAATLYVDTIDHWTWEMDNPSRKWRLENPDRDWSVMLATETTLRLSRFRIQWEHEDDGVSLVSNPIPIPTPEETGVPVFSSIADVVIPDGGAFELVLANNVTGTLPMTFSVETVPASSPKVTLTDGVLRIAGAGPDSIAISVTAENEYDTDTVSFNATILDTVTPPSTVTAAWRQVPILTSYALNQPPNYPDRWPYGQWNGEGKQWLTSGHMKGTRFLAIGDSNGLRGSIDGGRSICHPRARGFHGNVSHCIMHDPDDENRVIGATWQGGHAPLSYAGRTGIYLSTDWMHTAECKKDTPNFVRRSTINANPIDYRRGVGNTPTTRNWRVGWCADDGNGQPQLPARIYKSNDGGQTWDDGIVLSAIVAYNQITRIVYHPSDPNIAYVTTKAGIFRTTNDFNSNVTRIWASDFPQTVANLWIDPDDTDHMIAVGMDNNNRTGGYVKETTNGGSSWSTILPHGNAPATINPISFCVGPKVGGFRRIVVMPNSSGSIQVPVVMRWQTSTGSLGNQWQASWSDASPPPNNRWFRARIESFPGSVNSHIRTVVSRLAQVCPFASDTDPNLFALISNSNIWYSNNGGLDWACSSGMSGAASRQFVFDPVDGSHAYYSFYDVTGYESTNFPFGWVQYPATTNVPQHAASGGGGTASACWMIPSDAPNASKRGRVFSSSHFTNNDEQARLMRKDPGGNWVDMLSAAVVGANRNYDPVAFMQSPRAEPWIIYAGRWFSNNYGDSFPTERPYNIVACSDEAGGLSYWSNGGFTAIRRSTNYGASSSLWYTTSSRIGHTKSHPCSWLSPHEDDTMIVTDADGNLEVIRGAGTATRICQVNLLNQYSGSYRVNPATGESRLFTNAGAFDLFDHNVFYVWIRKFGVGAHFRVEFNDSLTAVVDISDISDNHPAGAFVSSMTIHPITGEICTSGAQGCWIRQRPGTDNPNALTYKCPRPHLTPQQTAELQLAA